MRKPITLIFVASILLWNCKKEDETGPVILKDFDGNVYTTVTIGTQVWMLENLKTTKYNDGTDIPNVTDSSVWSVLSTPAYCWYENNAAAYNNEYGGLYNWYVVNTGKLCPKGWHIPTVAEWNILVNYLGGRTIAGRKLKETGNTHWVNALTEATNESGFTGLPGGYCDFNGTFRFLGYNADYWSATEYNSTDAYVLDMYYEVSYLNIVNINKRYGFSVRCIKD
jgi:uncharacterized protein (TIGR02145 family)